MGDLRGSKIQLVFMISSGRFFVRTKKRVHLGALPHEIDEWREWDSEEKDWVLARQLRVAAPAPSRTLHSTKGCERTHR